MKVCYIRECALRARNTSKMETPLPPPPPSPPRILEEDLAWELEALKATVYRQQEQLERQKRALLEVVGALSSLRLDERGGGPRHPPPQPLAAGRQAVRGECASRPSWDDSPTPRYDRFKHSALQWQAAQARPRLMTPLAQLLSHSRRLGARGQSLRTALAE